jgi:hypothetical protein
VARHVHRHRQLVANRLPALPLQAASYQLLVQRQVAARRRRRGRSREVFLLQAFPLQAFPLQAAVPLVPAFCPVTIR